MPALTLTATLRGGATAVPEKSPAKLITSNRFVTGVTWVDGELWHGTWEGERSELRQVDPRTGEVLASLELPEGVFVSGLESDGRDRFYCGGANTGKVRAVRRPGRVAAGER